MFYDNFVDIIVRRKRLICTWFIQYSEIRYAHFVLSVSVGWTRSWRLQFSLNAQTWPLLDETQWHWHWHPQIRMDTLFNWTDVISIQAERTTKKLDNIALCASLCFLPEELLYYNQSSSNEKFLARACFQDILCIHWHHQSCELGEKKLQRGSKVVRIIFFIFVCYK